LVKITWVRDLSVVKADKTLFEQKMKIYTVLVIKGDIALFLGVLSSKEIGLSRLKWV